MEGGLRRDKVKGYGRMAAFAEFSVELFLNNGRQLCDLLMSGVLARYPTAPRRMKSPALRMLSSTLR